MRGGGSAGTTATTTTTVVPFKGKFSSGTVTLLDADGRTVTLHNGSGSINASDGRALVTFAANVKYPLVIKVTGTYRNEFTGSDETTTTPVRSFIADATAAAATSGIPATAITEIAVAGIEQAVGGDLLTPNSTLNTAGVNAAIDQAASLIGKDHTTMAVPQFNATTGAPTDTDTVALAALASVANVRYSSGGAHLTMRLRAMAQAYAVANIVTSVISQTEMNDAIAVAAALAPTVIAPVVTIPTTTAPISASAPIAQAKTLLTSLRSNVNLLANTGRTGFIQQQHDAAQADFNNVQGSLGDVTDVLWAMNEGGGLLQSGAIGGTTVYGKGECSVTVANTTVDCTQYSSWPMIRRMTLTKQATANTYEWSESLVEYDSTWTLVPVPGVTAQTGTVTFVPDTSLSVNGNIQPSYAPTTAYHHTNLQLTRNVTTSGGNSTASLTGSVSAVNSSGAFPMTTEIKSGSNMVAVSATRAPVSGKFVIQAKTANYQYDGTLDMSNFAQDASTTCDFMSPWPYTCILAPRWYAGTVSFTGDVTHRTNSAVGKFMTGTLSITENDATYDRRKLKSATNYPKTTVKFLGSITNNTVSPAMAYKVDTDVTAGATSAQWNTADMVLTYTDPSSNTVTANWADNGISTTLGTISMGGITISGGSALSTLVYLGTPASVTAGTATQIGTVSGSTVNFSDGSFVSMQ